MAPLGCPVFEVFFNSVGCSLSHLATAILCVPTPAFEKGHCYEPYIQNGNFTTSDPTYNIGTIVEFTCDPGHSLEQGPAVIECVNVRDPYWNDTEPLCRGESPPPTAPEHQGLPLPAKNKVPACKIWLNYTLVLG